MSKTLEQIIDDELQDEKYKNVDQLHSQSIVTTLIAHIRNVFSHLDTLDVYPRQRNLQECVSDILKAANNDVVNLYDNVAALTLAIAGSLWSDVQQVMESTSA